jgi:hypothetical protein
MNKVDYAQAAHTLSDAAHLLDPLLSDDDDGNVANEAFRRLDDLALAYEKLAKNDAKPIGPTGLELVMAQLHSNISSLVDYQHDELQAATQERVLDQTRSLLNELAAAYKTVCGFTN